MWVYRLGLEHAKRLMLSGEALDGREAERLGLVSRAFPAERLAARAGRLPGNWRRTPPTRRGRTNLRANQGNGTRGGAATSPGATTAPASGSRAYAGKLGEHHALKYAASVSGAADFNRRAFAPSNLQPSQPA